VAQSTTESEYTVIAAAVNLLRYQRGVACWFQPEVSLGPIEIFEDNQGAIALAKDDGGLKRTKHVDIRYLVVQEAVKNKEIIIEYIKSEDQLADILTKNLGRVNLEKMRDMILFANSF
jgi:hypothetical protein